MSGVGVRYQPFIRAISYADKPRDLKVFVYRDETTVRSDKLSDIMTGEEWRSVDAGSEGCLGSRQNLSEIDMKAFHLGLSCGLLSLPTPLGSRFQCLLSATASSEGTGGQICDLIDLLRSLNVCRSAVVIGL